MPFIIDNRERDLLEQFNKNNIEIETKNLDIGDIIIQFDNVEEIIIERKTIKDLAASIKDGRYKEQKLRLLNSDFKNKRIIYLLEGIVPSSGKVQGIPVSTIISTIIKMTLRDNIHVIRSSHVEESYKLIKKMEEKYLECTKDQKCDVEKVVEESIVKPEIDYASTIQIQKKANITPKICFISQLCQIPGVANETATAISENFESMTDLCQKIKDNKDNVFENIRIGKRASRISKKLCETIIAFLN